MFGRSRPWRAAVLIFGLLLLASACKKSTDNNNPSGAPETEPPTASPAVQSAGNFGLAGSVDHAFQGVGPPVQIALAGVSLGGTGPTGASGATASPATNGATPTQQGVMRITLDQVSAPLHDKCGVSVGDKVNVFWLTDTQFDTSLVNGTSFESSLEGRKLGVAGSIFVTGGNEQPNLGLPTPSTSPSATPSTVNTNCTLVADSVSSTASEVLPTVRPRATARRTAAPTARPTATPAPTPTPTQIGRAHV